MRLAFFRPVLSGFERTGPPDGVPARVVRHGRAVAGRARCGQSDGVKRRESDRFSIDEGPAGVRPRRTLSSRFGRLQRFGRGTKGTAVTLEGVGGETSTGRGGAAGADRCGHAGPCACTVNSRNAGKGRQGPRTRVDPPHSSEENGAASGREGADPRAEAGYCPSRRGQGPGRTRAEPGGSRGAAPGRAGAPPPTTAGSGAGTHMSRSLCEERNPAGNGRGVSGHACVPLAMHRAHPRRLRRGRELARTAACVPLAMQRTHTCLLRRGLERARMCSARDVQSANQPATAGT